MKHRRNSILINPPFQLRYSLYVITWLVPMIVIFPFITSELFDFLIRFSEQKGMTVDGLAGLKSVRTEVVTLLTLAEISFIAATFLISLRVSHKIAGPIFKVKQLIQGAQKGDWQTQAHLRKSDHFKDLAEEYNRLLESLRSNRKQSVESLSNLIGRLESIVDYVDSRGRSELEESIRGLKEIRERLAC